MTTLEAATTSSLISSHPTDDNEKYSDIANSDTTNTLPHQSYGTMINKLPTRRLPSSNPSRTSQPKEQGIQQLPPCKKEFPSDSDGPSGDNATDEGTDDDVFQVSTELARFQSGLFASPTTGGRNSTSSPSSTTNDAFREWIVEEATRRMSDAEAIINKPGISNTVLVNTFLRNMDSFSRTDGMIAGATKPGESSSKSEMNNGWEVGESTRRRSYSGTTIHNTVQKSSLVKRGSGPHDEIIIAGTTTPNTSIADNEGRIAVPTKRNSVTKTNDSNHISANDTSFKKMRSAPHFENTLNGSTAASAYLSSQKMDSSIQQELDGQDTVVAPDTKQSTIEQGICRNVSKPTWGWPKKLLPTRQKIARQSEAPSASNIEQVAGVTTAVNDPVSNVITLPKSMTPTKLRTPKHARKKLKQIALQPTNHVNDQLDCIDLSHVHHSDSNTHDNNRDHRQSFKSSTVKPTIDYHQKVSNIQQPSSAKLGEQDEDTMHDSQPSSKSCGPRCAAVDNADEWNQQQLQQPDPPLTLLRTVLTLPPSPTEEFIAEPREYDVLCGQNKLYSLHKGTMMFRQYILAHLNEYQRGSKGQRMALTKQIVFTMKMKYQTRFLLAVKPPPFFQFPKRKLKAKSSPQSVIHQEDGTCVGEKTTLTPAGIATSEMPSALDANKSTLRVLANAANSHSDAQDLSNLIASSSTTDVDDDNSVDGIDYLQGTLWKEMNEQQSRDKTSHAIRFALKRQKQQDAKNRNNKGHIEHVKNMEESLHRSTLWKQMNAGYGHKIDSTVDQDSVADRDPIILNDDGSAHASREAGEFAASSHHKHSEQYHEESDHSFHDLHRSNQLSLSLSSSRSHKDEYDSLILENSSGAGINPSVEAALHGIMLMSTSSPSKSKIKKAMQQASSVMHHLTSTNEATATSRAADSKRRRSSTSSDDEDGDYSGQIDLCDKTRIEPSLSTTIANCEAASSRDYRQHDVQSIKRRIIESDDHPQQQHVRIPHNAIRRDSDHFDHPNTVSNASEQPPQLDNLNRVSQSIEHRNQILQSDLLQNIMTSVAGILPGIAGQTGMPDFTRPVTNLHQPIVLDLSSLMLQQQGLDSRIGNVNLDNNSMHNDSHTSTTASLAQLITHQPTALPSQQSSAGGASTSGVAMLQPPPFHIVVVVVPNSAALLGSSGSLESAPISQRQTSLVHSPDTLPLNSVPKTVTSFAPTLSLPSIGTTSTDSTLPHTDDDCYPDVVASRNAFAVLCDASQATLGSRDTIVHERRNGIMQYQTDLNEKFENRRSECDCPGDDQVRRVYCVPTASDVLLGRGGKTNNHVGNAEYRKVVRRAYEEQYRYADRQADKTRISQECVNVVLHDWKGQFLKYEEDADAWYVVSNHAARNKTSQALRDYGNRGST